MKLRSQNVKLR